jgi:hypothetical protein
MQHQVALTPAQRAALTAHIRRGSASAFVQRRARILLQTDRHGPRLTDATVAAACAVAPRTVARVRADWARRGMACLERDQQHRPGPAPLLDGADEARIIAVACGAPPAGHARWTVRLLTDRVVALGIVEAISRETVRQTLKKTTSSPGACAAT